MMAATLAAVNPFPPYSLPEKQRKPLPESLIKKMEDSKTKADIDAIAKAKAKRERKKLAKQNEIDKLTP
jgi:hypothetical protein